MIGGYRSALKMKQNQVVFDEEQFLKSRPHLEEFLGQLLHFQHFRQFINGRIEKLKNRMPDKDLFDSEVLQYEEGQSVMECLDNGMFRTGILLVYGVGLG